MSSKDSKRSAREQLAEERKAQAAADKRKQTITNAIIVVVVVAVVVGIFVAVQASRTSGPDTAALPATVTEQGGGMPFGTGPVTVDIWEDFQCPACKQFEATNAETLKQQAQANEITLVIHPLSFLDEKLGNDSSLLAANAFGCSAASGRSPTTSPMTCAAPSTGFVTSSNRLSPTVSQSIVPRPSSTPSAR